MIGCRVGSADRVLRNRECRSSGNGDVSGADRSTPEQKVSRRTCIQPMRIRKFGLGIGSLASAAILAGTVLALGASQVFAQGPASVPAFRAYGTASVSGSPAPSGATVTAVSATAPGTTCGTGTVGANGSYFVDIQSIAGCSGNVTFTINGAPATNPPTAPPSVQGSPVQVNLTAGGAAAATPPPPPPPPAPVATAPPPPPPPPVATPVLTPVVPAAPPNTGVGPGPARPAPPVSAAPSVAQGPAVAAVPQLPNTGTGGLLSADEPSVAPWLLLGLALVAAGLLASSAFSYRRTR